MQQKGGSPISGAGGDLSCLSHFHFLPYNRASRSTSSSSFVPLPEKIRRLSSIR